MSVLTDDGRLEAHRSDYEPVAQRRELMTVAAYHACPLPQVAARGGPDRPVWDTVRRAAQAVAARIQRPAAIRRLAELAPAERVLSYTCDAAEAFIVATDAGLHRLEGPEGAGPWSRWGWERVARVAWDAETSTLSLVGQPPVLLDRVDFVLPKPGPLVAVARERVDRTRELATEVALPSGGSLGVVVRRQPITDRLDWFVYPDHSVDVDATPERAEIDTALAAVRAQTGL